MAVQFSVDLRNNRVDQVETTIGGTGTLKIFSGAAPANCATADSGTELAVISLPASFLTAAAAGSASIDNGPWQDASADAAGTAGHFRMYNGATCHLQGTCSATGGGGDMELDNAVLAAGQEFNVNSFTLTDGNA